MKRVEEVPIKNPALSKLVTQSLDLLNSPLSRSVPIYLISTKLLTEGSQDPNSNGVISNTDEFKLTTSVPGSLASERIIGNGTSNFLNSGTATISDQVRLRPVLLSNN